MIKTILWDFDGVILDSMKIKADGFLKLFEEYGDDELNKLYQFHFENGGISRFEKIKYFYNEILKKSITEEEALSLAGKFGNIVKKRLLDKSNLIQDSMEFIKRNYNNYHFHIVSGAEDNELNYLCKELDISKYFITIKGSPTKKSTLIQNILKEYSYDRKEILLIGDSMTDYNASLENAITFYGYNNLALNKFNYIESFKKFQI